MAFAVVLAVKFVYTAAILFGALGLFGHFSPGNILVTAAVLAVFLYAIGDLWVLPNYGVWSATAVDVPLAGLIIWATELILGGLGVPILNLAVALGVIAVAEHLFHLYLSEAGLPQ
ncbi:MAG: DUF2512 family protein [Bacillota bacterium]